MNQYTDNDYENDVEIDLVDLIFYFLKKWKVLIIAIILGAILGGGFCAIRNMRSQNQAVIAESKTEEDYEIDDESLANMEIAYRYRRQYLRQREYNNNSVLMNLDPNAFYRGTLRYYISAGDDTHEIWMLYQSLVYEYDFYKDLATALNWNKDASYMKELVSVGVNMGDPSIVHVDVMSEVETEPEADAETGTEESAETESKQSTTTMAGGWAVTYTVIAEDQDSCEKMLDVIRKKVQALDKSCQEEYADYSCILLSNNVQLYSDSGYLSTQKSSIDTMNTNLTNAIKLEDAFSKEEIEYYEKVFWGESETEEDLADTDLIAEEELEEASSDGLSKSDLVKWIMIGAFVGIMIWGFCYLIIYLMDSSIKTVSELRDSYHLPLLGHVASDEPGKKGWVDKLYDKVKGSSDTVPYIVSEIDTMEKGPVALCGDKEYNDVQSVMVELAENCDDVSANDFTSQNIDALKRVKETGSEILVVRLGKTKRSEIRRELEVCRMQNIKVVGTIAIES